MLGERKLVWQKALSQGFASSGGTSTITVLQQMGGKGEQRGCKKRRKGLRKVAERIIMWEYLKKMAKEK